MNKRSVTFNDPKMKLREVNVLRVFSGGSRISVRGGANPPGFGANIEFLPNVPKNCIKLRTFWSVEGRALGGAHLGSATAYLYVCIGGGGGGSAFPQCYRNVPPRMDAPIPLEDRRSTGGLECILVAQTSYLTLPLNTG